jgi:hypothetical protein
MSDSDFEFIQQKSSQGLTIQVNILAKKFLSVLFYGEATNDCASFIEE